MKSERDRKRDREIEKKRKTERKEENGTFVWGFSFT